MDCDVIVTRLVLAGVTGSPGLTLCAEVGNDAAGRRTAGVCGRSGGALGGERGIRAGGVTHGPRDHRRPGGNTGRVL